MRGRTECLESAPRFILGLPFNWIESTVDHSANLGDAESGASASPPLAFGEGRAATGRADVRHAVFEGHGLTLTSWSHPAAEVDIAAIKMVRVVVPVAGRFSVDISPIGTRLTIDSSALLLAAQSCSISITAGSWLVAEVDPLVLTRIANGMAGAGDDMGFDLRLDQPRVLELHPAGVPLRAGLLHLCRMIDLYGHHAKALESIGLCEQILRHIVLMLRPECLSAPLSSQAAEARHALEPVCEYIRSRLHAPLALSDLEVVSGLSRRSLQYAFEKRFQLTPMQWVREQRLCRTRALLSSGDPKESVTLIGIQCGFANLGAFSKRYRQRFGEYPSQTLRNSSRQ